MKKLLSVILLSFVVSANSFASDSIGVIDVERIVSDSLVMRDVQSKINKKQEEYQKEVDKKQESLAAEQKKIESRKTTLSKAAQEKEVKEFESKLNQFNESVEKKQNSIRKASLDVMGKINEAMREIVSEISKEKKLSVIISNNQTFFYKDELDITDEVLKRLNKKITKVDVKFDQ